MSVDLSNLNEQQRQAVMCVEGPLLVLAGAGSGKTSVLTYRIAHMVEDLNIPPWEILAITFTNKAAREMQERISGLIGDLSRGMWISTFHKCCGRILRSEPTRVGLRDGFTIAGDDDQKRIAKQIMADLHIDEKVFNVRTILSFISNAKNSIILPDEYAATATSPVERAVSEVYREYQKRLLAANSVDFDDMLLLAYKLLHENEDVRRAYQERFKYLLVDEYQDTNHVQYEICKLLAGGRKNLMVVGDDDQSIYSWRGADVANILDFESDFSPCKTIKLEENYRSTSNILNAANAVIANNTRRKQKKLFTSGGEGERIGVYYANDERDEGRWIAGEIEKSINKGEVASYDDVAILYRTNAQSRTLEDMMLRAGVPYRIVGGTKFFERREIRDVMAYISLVVNPSDNASFERVVNVPKRGVGPTTLKKIQEEAIDSGVSDYVALGSLLSRGNLRGAVKDALLKFYMMIDEAGRFSGDLKDIVEAIIDRSGIIADLETQNTDEAMSRIENIKELLTVVQEFSETHEQIVEYLPPKADEEDEAPKTAHLEANLSDFLEWVSLRSDLDSETSEHAVVLMTCHSAKGLEFDHVYVSGLEEGIFPGSRSFSDNKSLEEERRLAYVAITRAKKRLTLSHAQTRRIYGRTESSAPSRFLREIPATLCESKGIGSRSFEGTGWEKRGSRRGIMGSGSSSKASVSNISSSSANRRSSVFSGQAQGSGQSGFASSKREKASFSPGQIVEHKTFGRGKVVSVDGDKIKIYFERSGKTKQLLADYAPIVAVG